MKNLRHIAAFKTIVLSLLIWSPVKAEGKCEPNKYQIALYENNGFKGRCILAGFGDFPSPEWLFHNYGIPSVVTFGVSSIKVGDGAQAYVCSQNDFRGRCQTIKRDRKKLDEQDIGDDAIKAARVQPRGADVKASCSPGPNQVAFFETKGFEGACLIKGQGEFPHWRPLAFKDNTISAIKVGDNRQAFVCSEAEYKGVCQYLRANRWNLAQDRIGDNTITSVQVQEKGWLPCDPPANKVSLYADAPYHATGWCKRLSFGYFNTPKQMKMDDNSVSSVRLGDDAQIILCRDDFMYGQCVLINENVPDLAVTPKNIGDNQVSSVLVEKLGTKHCMPGAHEIAVFEHSDFVPPCGILNAPGRSYFRSEMGIRMHTISSIRMGEDVARVVMEWTEGRSLKDYKETIYKSERQLQRAQDQVTWLTFYSK